MLRKILTKLGLKSKSPKSTENQTTTSSESTSENNLVHHEQLTGTPFTLVRNENKWCLVLGNYRITENYPTRNEALERLDKDFWLVVTHLVTIVADINNKKMVPISKEERNF